ncbi:MAG: hypothetical protein SFZ24_12600 [Planctomycetota bacterium]|nr:hypothetical protein [Planctomycetota bacterium]
MSDANDPIISLNGLDAGSRARAGADGELSDAQLGILRSEDAGAESRMAFERDLRALVERAMSSPERAPAGLADRIRGALAAEEREAAQAPGALKFPGAGVNGAGRGEVYPVRPALRRQAMLAAAAALALFAGGAALLSLRPGGWSGGSSTLAVAPAPGSLGAAGAPLERVTRLVSFTSEQHGACESAPFFEKKMTARTPAAAAAAAIEILHKVPSVLELRSEKIARAGYAFAGLGPCRVPGSGRSAHLIYRADPAVAPGAPEISLFVQEDTGELAIEPGFYYTNEGCESRLKTSCNGVINVWREEGLIYYLLAPQGVCGKARQTFCDLEQSRPLF